MRLQGETVVIIGGGSGIGLAVANMAHGEGARLVVGGRSRNRLDAAIAGLGAEARAIEVDTADPASIQTFFAQVGRFDHLLVTAATYRVVAIDDPDDDAAESPFRSKFWGQYRAVRAALPYLSSSGSITLMAGAAGARPLKGGSAYAACNSAIEGLGRALAIELAPMRVNTVSPGTIDGSLWRSRPDAVRETAFEGWRDMALLRRTGTEDEVAQAILFLMTNRFMTGSTLYPDGGYALKP
ncbi:NAD(P)-dependent dehydrogenase, short-chain alcohol dehydrogenase family [Methylobacterium sp. 174MFSha1.1]|nr:NAD(P)-dependent dehydrogenase, short-chain alcohol dehydrogenase family [Methylobacterium sp. 174MFSha1.1]